MAVFTVTTPPTRSPTTASSACARRWPRPTPPPAADTIGFASGLEGKTLTLTQGELVLTRDVTIDGDRNNDGKEVTLSGGDASRILHITGGSTDVSLRDLTLTDGRTTGDGEDGGAIRADDGADPEARPCDGQRQQHRGIRSADGGGIYTRRRDG